MKRNAYELLYIWHFVALTYYDDLYLCSIISFCKIIFNGYYLCSYDDKVACQMILDKMGLKGYQVWTLNIYYYWLGNNIYEFTIELMFLDYCNGGLRNTGVISSEYFTWQIGKTKVFLRAGQMAELDARRTEILGNAAKIIQRQIRTYIAQKEFISLRKAAVQLQSCWRGIRCSSVILHCM